MNLTPAQRKALEFLGDEQKRETHKGATGKYGRINRTAAETLRRKGLVRFLSSFDHTLLVRISDEGKAVLDGR